MHSNFQVNELFNQVKNKIINISQILIKPNITISYI